MVDFNEQEFYDVPSESDNKAPNNSFEIDKKTLIRFLIGIVVIIAVFLVVLIVVNQVKKRKIVKIQNENVTELVNSKVALETSKCVEGENGQGCFDTARVKIARKMGLVDACQGVGEDANKNCVNLIAGDTMDITACRVLDGDARKDCEDRVNFKLAVASNDATRCLEIKNVSRQNDCIINLSLTASEENNCDKKGIDKVYCEKNLILQNSATGNPDDCRKLNGVDAESCLDSIRDTDSDADGLSLQDEFSLGTSDDNQDTDGDGLLDGKEVNDYGTDPLNQDTDGDGFTDFEEIQNGFDPLSA